MDGPTGEGAALSKGSTEDPLARPARLFFPPRLVDAVILAAVALLYIGFVLSKVAIHGPPSRRHFGPIEWDARTILAAALFPTVIALWWRRRRPLAVLAVAIAASIVASPYAGLLLLVALYGAALRLPLRKAAVAWGIAAAVSVFIGRSIDFGAFRVSEVIPSAAITGAAAALGLYVGARRAYVDRLRERALFARALASFLPPTVAELVESKPRVVVAEGRTRGHNPVLRYPGVLDARRAAASPRGGRSRR